MAGLFFPHLLFLSVWTSFGVFLASFSGGTAPYRHCILTLLSFGNVIICLTTAETELWYDLHDKFLFNKRVCAFSVLLGHLAWSWCPGCKREVTGKMKHGEVQMK